MSIKDIHPVNSESEVLSRETIIQSNDAVGNISLGVMPLIQNQCYYFDINGIHIWVERIVIEVNEVRCGALAHGLVGGHRVCSLYVQKNHLDDVKALLQEVQQGVPKMTALTQQQICDQGKSIEQTLLSAPDEQRDELAAQLIAALNRDIEQSGLQISPIHPQRVLRAVRGCENAQ